MTDDRRRPASFSHNNSTRRSALKAIASAQVAMAFKQPLRWLAKTKIIWRVT